MKIIFMLIIILAVSLTGCSVTTSSIETYWSCMDGCYDMQEICAEEFNFTATYERQSICDNICADKYMIA